MIVNSINTESITPVEYNHIHDSSLIFRKYRENFDFGLTVNQYYFNKDAKDRKTNYDTQYILSDIQPLSTVLELKIPYTKTATNTFTTTIRHNGKYLKTDFDWAADYTWKPGDTLNEATSSLSATFVESSEFNTLSSHFFFTFTLTTVALRKSTDSTILSSAAANYLPSEDRVIITQEYNSNTYYLTAASATDTEAWFTPYSAVSAAVPTFRYNLDDNKIIFTNSTPELSGDDGRLCNNNNVLSLSSIDNFYGDATAIETCIFNITRYELTKNFKTLPNSFVKYTSSYNTDTVDLNTSTITEHVSNNYFVYSNNYNYFQKKQQNTNTVHADLFPLKNQATLHEYYAENNHFNSEPGYLNRVYEKIHAGTNQQTGTDKIGVSYNIGTYDIAFKPNKLTYFTTPSSLSPYTVLHIKDSKIENLGAIPGDNPLMSDKVFKRRIDIKNNSYSNDTDPTYLCSWLSGNQDGETKWVDRYYNPTIKNFNQALSATSYYKVVTAAGAETTETFDVSSSLTFEPNNDYMFYHIGSTDYENLFKAYDTQYNEALNVEYKNFKGVPKNVNKVLNDDELILDGETFGRVTTNSVGDFSTNFWLSTEDTTLPFGYQILGNYFEDGFGIFNTDLVTPNIILPVVNNKSNRVNPKKSKLLFLNNDFEVYDEIILMDGVDEIDIKGIGRKDNFSEFYVLGDNNIIYVFNSNNNLISKIENLKDSSVVIDDFEVAEDKLHVLFNPVTTSPNNFFTYNFNTNKSSTTTSSVSADTKGQRGRINRHNNQTTVYTVDSQNGYGNEISFDSQHKAYAVRQHFPDNVGDNSNYAQKDSSPKDATDVNRIQAGFGTGVKVNGVLIDDEDNIIVLHDNNIISILDNNRKLKKSREFCNINNYVYQQSYMDLIYDFEDGVYKKYILFIQEFADGFRLTKLNDKLHIISSKKFYGMDLVDLKLTKTVTSYYYLRKIGANKKRIKVLLKIKPKFSSTGVISKVKSVIDFDLSTLNPGYNHFFVNVSLRKGCMELYVNGRLYKKVTFAAGAFALDNVLGSGLYVGAVSTPFYLTLANRLGQPKKYFINNAKIKGFKLYNKTMSYFDILAHYNYHIGDKNLVWSYPLGQRTYIDTIDKLSKFTFPEKINNNYKVNIVNTDIKDEKLKDKIKERISKELEKITPYYDNNQEININ